MYTWIWKGKRLVPDIKRGAVDDMIKNAITIDDVLQALEYGTKVVRRRKDIEEKWLLQGRTIVIAVIEDEGEYWCLRHVSRIRATKKKARLIQKFRSKGTYSDKAQEGEDNEMRYLW